MTSRRNVLQTSASALLAGTFVVRSADRGAPEWDYLRPIVRRLAPTGLKIAKVETGGVHRGEGRGGRWHQRHWAAFHRRGGGPPLTVKDGHFPAPTDPGWGIRLREALVERAEHRDTAKG